MQSPNIFLGREAELTKLMDAWDRVEQGNPQWIAIVAESGVGKTRLVQEFYRQLAAAENTSRMPAVGYWPDELPIDRDKLGLNPDIDSFSVGAVKSIADIPWLWWGLRGQGDVRNATGSGCAARDAKADLELHYAAVIARRMKESAARRVGTEAVKVVSNALGFGLIETFFNAFDPGSAAYEAVRAVFANDEIVIRGEKSKQSKKLQNQLAEVISAFLGQQIPVILVLDDAHWLDADTVAFVSRLVSEQVPKKMKLMILTTSWAREWNGSPIRKLYESFAESKFLVPLGGIEQNSAVQFLRFNFPGLTESDVNLIWTRSGGNFRYLVEITKALEKSPRDYFSQGNKSQSLSDAGRRRLRESEMEIEKLIEERFLDMPVETQVALERSSYQGPRFAPALTARANNVVGGTVEEEGNKTLDDIHLGDDPGAMITKVSPQIREFLQGPYWRIIRQRFDDNEDEAAIVRKAYRDIVLRDSLDVADSILESLLSQWLENELEEAERIYLLARLLEIAFKGNRYQAGLRWLKQLASSVATLPRGESAVRPTINPTTIFAAVRIFCQYAFGAGDQADRQKLEKFCVNWAINSLAVPIYEFAENRTLPAGCDLKQLIEWCNALVNLYEVLGHTQNHLQWLGNLCNLKKMQLDLGATESSARISYTANLLHFAEKQIPMAETRVDWDKLSQDFQTARITIELLEGAEKEIFQAWHKICVLYLGRVGRRHYPEVQDWGDDYHAYCYAANKLGDILSEIELAEGSDENNSLLGLSDDLLEALLHGSTLTLEYASNAGHEIASEFLDRLRLVSDEIFKRIDAGIYVPISLGFHAMDSNLSVMSMLEYLASAERYAANPTRPEMPGVEMYMLASRNVETSEAVQMMTQVTSAVARYRDLGMLSMNMIVIGARAGYDRLCLTRADATVAIKVFDGILEDVVLTMDGERFAYGEQVQLIPWLVRIFDNWLSDAPDAEEIWVRLRNSYQLVDDKRFNELVARIRE